MEYLHFWENALVHLVAIAKFFLETTSVICIILGFIQTLRLAWHLNLRASRFQSFNTLRLRLGMWLGLALEFQLGADILGTTVTPTLDSLARLGIIALIRTFLNYFLGKELEAELTLEKEKAGLVPGEEI